MERRAQVPAILPGLSVSGFLCPVKDPFHLRREIFTAFRMLHQDDLDDFVPGLVTEKGDDSFAGETGGAAESLVCFPGKACGEGTGSPDVLLPDVLQAESIK